MIEFKAECGHTVRARDEDAGGMVRCSYCGKNTNVPEGQKENLDFLLDEAEKTGAQAVGTAPKRRRRFRGPGRPRMEGFNPFPIIVRLCYATLLICIVVIVARNWVIPLFQSAPVPKRGVSTKKDDRPPAQGTNASATAAPQRGLLSRTGPLGFYVTSVPTGADVYYVMSTQAPVEGRIRNVSGSKHFLTPGGSLRLTDGMYVVEVVLPWNDPSLTRYVGYKEFRRQLERATDKERRRLMEEYFIPDEANSVFVDETPDQKFLVRQYRDIEVREGRSAAVRALFLPRGNPSPAARFSLEKLVLDHLPDATAYLFDEGHVLGELDYYGADEVDRPWILKALSRIGTISYVTESGRILVFKIGVEDGAFSARVIRESGK